MHWTSVALGVTGVAMTAASLTVTYRIVEEDRPEEAASTTGATTATTAPMTDMTGMTDMTAVAGEDMAGEDMTDDHTHGSASYEDRVASATATEQSAAATLLDEVTATLAAYDDVAAAVADGYVAPTDPQGQMWHYRSPATIRDGVALDTAHPEGLVYFVRAGAEPVLVGALFIARPGQPAPTPGGPITQWHTHDEACGSFVIDADHPCASSGRMFHVWIAEGAVDPFGLTAGFAFGRA